MQRFIYSKHQIVYQEVHTCAATHEFYFKNHGSESVKIKDTLLEIQEQNEELQARIEFLQTENNRLLSEHRDLHDKTIFQNRQIQGLKFRNSDLRRELDRVTNMGMFEFANEFCNDDQLEDAGHQLARSLGGGMTREEVAIETAENGYKPYVGDDF